MLPFSMQTMCDRIGCWMNCTSQWSQGLPFFPFFTKPSHIKQTDLVDRFRNGLPLSLEVFGALVEEEITCYCERSKTWVGDLLERSSCVITEVLVSQNPNIWHSLGKGYVQKCYCTKYKGIRSSVSVSGTLCIYSGNFFVLGIYSLLSNFVLWGTCILLQLMVIYQNKNKNKNGQSRVHPISYGSVGINTVPLSAFLE